LVGKSYHDAKYRSLNGLIFLQLHHSLRMSRTGY